jgi:hypothetical protein
MNHIIREATKIELHPNNMNREDGSCLSHGNLFSNMNREDGSCLSHGNLFSNMNRKDGSCYLLLEGTQETSHIGFL